MRSVVFPLILSLVACGSTSQKLCKKSSECMDGYDYDTCLSEYEELEEIADAMGCGDVLAEFAKCNAKEAECVDGYLEASSCTGETLAYFECFFDGYTLTFGTSTTTTSSTSDTGY